MSDLLFLHIILFCFLLGDSLRPSQSLTKIPLSYELYTEFSVHLKPGSRFSTSHQSPYLFSYTFSSLWFFSYFTNLLTFVQSLNSFPLHTCTFTLSFFPRLITNPRPKGGPQPPRFSALGTPTHTQSSLNKTLVTPIILPSVPSSVLPMTLLSGAFLLLLDLIPSASSRLYSFSQLKVLYTTPPSLV